MGSYISKQPNGLLCRFSTSIDTVTHWNMTEDDYVELCAEIARQNARETLKNEHFFVPFECMIEDFCPNNETSEQFLSHLRDMGDETTTLEDLPTEDFDE